MLIWKDGKTTEQVLEEVIRDYLIRCHKIISKNYPKIAGMDPIRAADHLLQLKRTGRAEIKLHCESDKISCTIIEKG